MSIAATATDGPDVDEAGFRRRVRAFLEANVPMRSDGDGGRRPAGPEGGCRGPRLSGCPLRRRIGRAHLAPGVRGSGAPRALPDHLQRGGHRLRHPRRRLHHRLRHVHANRPRPRDRSPQAALRPPGRPGRGDLVPAVLGAVGRVGRRQPALHRGARRRRVGAQRPEGLDVGRSLLAVRHRPGPDRSRPAQASGAVDVHPGHAQPRA